MVNETGQVKPTNKTVWDSKNIHVQYKRISNASSMYPGRFVKRGTNDDDVVCGTLGSAVYGVIAYEYTTKKYRPATISTIQTVEDLVAIVNGPGAGVVAYVEGNGYSFTKGAHFKSGANGALSAGTDGSDHIVAIAEESGSGNATAMVRLLI